MCSKRATNAVSKKATTLVFRHLFSSFSLFSMSCNDLRSHHGRSVPSAYWSQQAGRLPMTICSQHDHNYRLSICSGLVKRKMKMGGSEGGLMVKAPLVMPSEASACVGVRTLKCRFLAALGMIVPEDYPICPPVDVPNWPPAYLPTADLPICPPAGLPPFFHLDILPEARYLHLVCLPKNNENALNFCKEPLTC